MKEQLERIKSEFIENVNNVTSIKELESLRVKYFSRNGIISVLFDKLREVPKEDKRELGKNLNELKEFTYSLFEQKKKDIELKYSSISTRIDLSLPPSQIKLGTKHILNQTLEEIKNIFKSMGFSVFEGPEIESDYYNFEALNFPSDHPARDMQDTFFINKNFLLRTHTSPVQIRVMEKMKPPVRAIMPGRVYRNEAINARSYSTFQQVEGLYVDKDVTFAELKGTLVSFAKQFYGEDLKYRFRPSFFPFTEPSAEMDITCFLCKGEGCKVCKYAGWLEILGCGMVDPNVFNYVNYDPENYTGYAFGMGIERIALLKYGINDIRLFFENDIRFLTQF